jgi:hypothetical protein
MPGCLLIAQTLEIPNYIHYIRKLQVSDKQYRELKYTVHAKKIMAKQDVKGAVVTNIWYIEVLVDIIRNWWYIVTTCVRKEGGECTPARGSAFEETDREAGKEVNKVAFDLVGQILFRRAEDKVS